MKMIQIPDTDLTMSGVGFGTVNAGLKWDGDDAARMLEGYLAGGGNVIDTAHVYSDWVPGEIARSERVVGEWIHGRGHREDFILMTKGGHPRFESMTTSRLSKEEMTSDLDSSLEKLQVDYVDIYFYHRDEQDGGRTDRDHGGFQTCRQDPLLRLLQLVHSQNEGGGRLL